MRQAVIVISSHVARGSVGNRAAVFALEALSFPVWAVPTITLPWHPGHGPATRIIPEAQNFASFLNDLANAPWISEVGAVLSGYMANSDQAREVAKLVAQLKQKNPDLLYLCDPVIGDNGGLYVAEKTARAIRESLLPIADITTPNRFELGWLANQTTPETLNDAFEIAGILGPESVLVTSCLGDEPGTTGNLLKTANAAWLAMHHSLKNPPNGPGDLTAAIFLGHQLAGLSPQENLQHTTSSVLEILNQSAARGSNELTLETDSQSIHHPKIMVPAREFKVT